MPRKSWTTEGALARFREVHGEQYQYPNFNAEGVDKKILITCRDHGDFYQTLMSHLSGKGCRECGKKKIGDRLRASASKFIEKAESIHGYKYDYSKINYKTARDKVEIACPEHGPFWQTPDSHTRSGTGSGCPECSHKAAGEKGKMGMEELVRRVGEKHGDKYVIDTDQEYIDNSSDLVATCKHHGQFTTSALKLLKAGGCTECTKINKKGVNSKPVEHFLERAAAVHGDRYDYSKVEYQGTGRKVLITCHEHGDFPQTPQKHMAGRGCPECAKILRGLKSRNSLENFVEKSIEQHGAKYDYSLVDYQGRTKQVKIICPTHGVYLQKPGDHAKGKGCTKCAHEEASTRNADTVEDFVRKSESVWGDKYDYSGTHYKNNTTPTNIRCKKHDFVFHQRPGNHLSGREGCEDCLALINDGWVADIYKTDKESNLYLMRLSSKDTGEEFFKVGLSVKPKAREHQISVEGGYEVENIGLYTGPANELLKCEQITFVSNKEMKYTPQNSFGGMTECFKLEHLETVKNFIEEYLNSKGITVRGHQ